MTFFKPSRWSKILLAATVLLSACGPKAPAEKQLVFWHWWTDRQPVLEKLAQKYHEETGTRVRFQVAAPVGSEYNNKLQAAAQANTLPDIIGLAAGGEFLARYINAGKILELTDALKGEGEWIKEFYPRATEDFTYKAGNQFDIKPDSIWAVPVSAMTIQVYYNKKLFAKAGLDPEKPPQTWAEFLQTCKTLNDAGVIPMSVGFGDLWMIGAFLEPYAMAYLGPEKMKSSFLGRYSYTSPEWKSVMQHFVDMKNNKALVKGSVTLPNKESEQLFASEKVAMIMNGSWGVSVFNSMNPQLDYGIMGLPKPDKAPFPLYVRGGVGSGAAVTAASEQKEEAVKFLRWLTAKEQQTIYANEGRDLPANRNCEDQLTPTLRVFASGMNKLMPDLGVSEKFEVQETLWKGVQSVFIGEATPTDILLRVEAAKQKSLRGI